MTARRTPTPVTTRVDSVESVADVPSVMLDRVSVRARLAALAALDHRARHVFGAEGHHFVLAAPWSEHEIVTFELRHRVQLPDDYRWFIAEIGAFGAGPGFGLFKPGEWDGNGTGGSWEDLDGAVGPLADPFPFDDAWNLPSDRLAALTHEPDDDEIDREYWASEIACGSLPIATIGCAIRVVLIISGRQRGRVWIDDRANFGGLYPESGMCFDDWYAEWLDAAEGVANGTIAAPPVEPRRREPPNECVALPRAALPAAERLRQRVCEAVARGIDLDLGGVGCFRARPHPHFEQGPELRAAHASDTALDRDDDACKVFNAVLEQVANGVAVTVPGFFSSWSIPASRWSYIDYLGRSKGSGEPATLVIAIDPGVSEIGIRA